MKMKETKFVAAAVVVLTGALLAQKEAVDGIRNFTKIDATYACGGSTEPTAMAELGRRGYKTAINLRDPSEAGAANDESMKAAAAAGLRYVNIPFDSKSPDAAAVDRFLAVIKEGGQPVFVYCATGSRAAAFWLVKRMLVDGWAEDKATSEAVSIGLSSPALKQFALDYVARHK